MIQHRSMIVQTARVVTQISYTKSECEYAVYETSISYCFLKFALQQSKLSLQLLRLLSTMW